MYNYSVIIDIVLNMLVVLCSQMIRLKRSTAFLQFYMGEGNFLHHSFAVDDFFLLN